MPAKAASPQSQSRSKTLPPLPNGDKYATIVTRFAPNPDFVLHLGSIRAIILSHDYARMKPRCRRSEEHTSELQSRVDLVCSLLLEKKKSTSSKNTKDQVYAQNEM